MPRRDPGSGRDRAGDDDGAVAGPAPDGSCGERTGLMKAAVETAAIVLLEVMRQHDMEV